MEKKKTKLTENLAFPETDVTLVVEGQKIHVNKSVLSAHSPVFDTMFKILVSSGKVLQKRFRWRTRKQKMLLNF